MSKTYKPTTLEGSIRDACDSLDQVKLKNKRSVMMRPTVDAKGDFVSRSICGSQKDLERAINHKEKTKDYAQLKQMLLKHKNDPDAKVKAEISGFNVRRMKKIETSQRGHQRKVKATAQGAIKKIEA